MLTIEVKIVFIVVSMSGVEGKNYMVACKVWWLF